MRLNVFLAHNGIGSRRTAFDIVQCSRVLVNGRIETEPSTDIDPAKDVVVVDGRRVDVQSYIYVMLNKSAGYVATKSDPYANKIVTDLLPEGYRHLQSVGRLDKDTEGLLLFTNNGQIAQKLLHPKFEKDKTYLVRIEGRLAEAERKKLENGIDIDDEHTAPAQVQIVDSSEHLTNCLVTIHEGKKRQIRRMMDAVGHPVMDLKRLTFGPLKLGDLKPGEWRLLTQQEVESLEAL